MSNSKLASYVKLSPNCTKPRNHTIDTITIHCMAGNLSVETCGVGFARASRRASSNYGIGSDGRIALYVDERNRSWCSGNKANDNRAITIEVANTAAHDPWPVSDKAYVSLINLLVDICRRNGIKKLLWQGDKSLVGQVDKQNMTVHRWFQAKACPGDWLYNRHGVIAAAVNARLTKTNEEDDVMTQEKFEEMYATMIAKAHGDNPSNWAKEATDKAKAKGMFKGDGHDNYDWQEPLTREAAAVIANNMGLLDK